MTFRIRGVIEGFYNRLWTWDERNRVVDRVGELGFTTYVYAPKEDRLQNAGWRTPYPDQDRRRLEALAERCRRAGLELWIGLRPLGISYLDDADAALVAEQLAAYLALGASRAVLLADDIPAELDARTGGRFASLAAAHAWLVERAADATGADRLVFVPTDYHGAGTPYLEALGAAIPAAVAMCWTGPEVCSPTITAAQADAVARVMLRRPLLWDNYPVNDAAMTDELHLGPIRGRSSDLAASVDGVLVNPALQPEASLIPLATWAEYVAAPEAYDPDAAWHRAVASVAGADDAPAVEVIAAALDRSVIQQGWDAPTAAQLASAARRLDRFVNRRLANDLAPFVERALSPRDAGPTG